MICFFLSLETMVFTPKQRRALRKSQSNIEFSVLSVFITLNYYKISLINRATSPMLLHHLFEVARKTTEFTIDTEHHYYTTTINNITDWNTSFTISVIGQYIILIIYYITQSLRSTKSNRRPNLDPKFIYRCYGLNLKEKHLFD